MKKLLWVLQKQDFFNKILLVSAVVIAVFCLVNHQPLYGLIVFIVFCFICASRKSSIQRRRKALYGTIHFHMPDGEVYRTPFREVCVDCMNGNGGRYHEREVDIVFPYNLVNPDNELETGFGLNVELEGFEDEDHILSSLKRDELIRVTGQISVKKKDYFTINHVKSIQRV